MGKYRSFIMFGVAILLALVSTVLIINWLQTKAKVKEAAPILDIQEVATAKVDLNWGTKLAIEFIEMKPFLKKSLPSGYFSDTSALVGRVLISPIKANEPIYESRLAPTSLKTGGVAAVVSPKKRAVAVRVDKVIGVSGFIHPGNRVDILVSLPQGRTQTPPLSTSPFTKTVLENILVLAVGPEIETKGKEEKAAPVDVITLEVTPEEAEKLAMAVTEGKILLVLRNFNDTEDVITQGITIPTLLSSYASGPPTETKPAASKVSSKRPTSSKPISKPVAEKKVEEKTLPFVIELIKGGKASEVKFERSE